MLAWGFTPDIATTNSSLYIPIALLKGESCFKVAPGHFTDNTATMLHWPSVHLQFRVKRVYEAGVEVWARKTICITVKLKPRPVGGACFPNVSAVAHRRTPSLTRGVLTAHRAGHGQTKGWGQCEPESPLELRPVGSLASPGKKRIASFSPDAP